VRNGKIASSVLFLDMATSRRGFAMPFRVLKESLGVNEVALHTGKYVGEDLKDAARETGMKLVSPYRMYYELP
jgi:hypothetical protein